MIKRLGLAVVMTLSLVNVTPLFAASTTNLTSLFSSTLPKCFWLLHPCQASSQCCGKLECELCDTNKGKIFICN